MALKVPKRKAIWNLSEDFYVIRNRVIFCLAPGVPANQLGYTSRCPRRFTLTFLAPDVFRPYSAKPERLRDIASAQHNLRTIVIDEVQKVPHLLDVVHSLIEEQRNWKFVLTGSSARKLRRAGVDLLAGRALLREMHPFMAAELGDGFSLEGALRIGLVPLAVSAKEPEAALKAYTGLYLREEVQMEGIVRRIGDFSRFLESASFSHGAVLNISDVARDCQVNRKTAESYFSILEDLMLAFRVPMFTKRAKRNLVSHPKFFFFDSGVFKSIRPAGLFDKPQEIDGAALEGLVAQHLRAWTAYGEADAQLHYWRTKSGNEVDLVLYGSSVFCAIEVKSTDRIKQNMVNGLLAFKEDYPEAEVCLLYRGTERIKIKNVLCVPCKDFLMDLIPGKPIRF